MIVRNVSAVACGVLFGLGLAVSHMTNPAKVIGFLDIAGAWDPSLLVVLMSAVVVAFAGFRFLPRMRRPLFDTTFERPATETIDGRLVAGAVMFGAGWGLAGYCPGPGFVAFSGFVPGAALFVGTFLVGSGMYRLLNAAVSRVVSPRPQSAERHSLVEPT